MTWKTGCPHGCGSSAGVPAIPPNRWKKSGLCDPSNVLILHAQSTLAKSPLGDRRVLADRNLRECTEIPMAGASSLQTVARASCSGYPLPAIPISRFPDPVVSSKVLP